VAAAVTDASRHRRASECQKRAHDASCGRHQHEDVSIRSHLALLLLVACSPLHTESPDASSPPAEGDLPIDPRFAPLVDQIEAERVALGAPGVAVLVMENGSITFAHGFGLKNPDAADKVDAGTLFRIGSVTKMMTATGVLQLVASGDVALTDPVTRAIPGFKVTKPAGAESTITVQHLLTHASGLYDYLGEINSTDHSDEYLSSYTTGAFTTVEYQMSPAGRMWNYSNPNFTLAGLIFEKGSGLPYRIAMHDRVFEPLGMKRTLWRGEEVLADGNYAHGLTTDQAGKRLVQAPDAYDNPWGRPAGFAFSSVYDLARFVTFLMEGNDAVLPAAQRIAMQSPQMNMEVVGDYFTYGYALFVNKGVLLPDGYHATPLISHGGAIDGFSTDLYYVPATKFAVIVLANKDNAYLSKSVALALKSYANLPPPSSGPSFDVDPATFTALVGTYQDDFNVGRIIVSKTGSDLTVSMPDLDAQNVSYTPKLDPLGPDNFLLTIEDYEADITFIRDQSGNPEYIRDRYFVARRTSSSPAVPIDRDQLRRRLRGPRERLSHL
jgi:D-alanyl-D-alanine carboxypeptidase